jgi:hypothetical protein
MFKSGAHEISAFAGEKDGKQLPEQFKPWSEDGFVENGVHPPHNLSRFKIENAIKHKGFQLWRQKTQDKK